MKESYVSHLKIYPTREVRDGGELSVYHSRFKMSLFHVC